MTVTNTLGAGFSDALDKAGELIRIRYFSQEPGSVWDDEVSLTMITGSELWVSGIVLPLNTAGTKTSEDVVLLEQGKLITQDQRLYVNGSLDFTGVGSNFIVRIGMNGSPNPIDIYNMIPLGGIPYEVEGTQIYKKVFIRKKTGEIDFYILTESRDYLMQEDGYRLLK